MRLNPLAQSGIHSPIMNRFCIIDKREIDEQLNRNGQFHAQDLCMKIRGMNTTYDTSGWRDRARLRMEELKITQRALAEQLEVTQGTIGHWLAGRREPDIPMLCKLANALDMDAAYLAFGYLDSERVARMASYAKDLSQDDLDAVTSLMMKLAKAKQD